MTDMEWAEPYLAVRQLEEEDKFLVVAPQVFSLRVAVATPTSMGEHWCYRDVVEALIAFQLYPEMPEGWTRHMLPNGEMEYPR